MFKHTRFSIPSKILFFFKVIHRRLILQITKSDLNSRKISQMNKDMFQVIERLYIKAV